MSWLTKSARVQNYLKDLEHKRFIPKYSQNADVSAGYPIDVYGDKRAEWSKKETGRQSRRPVSWG